MHRMELDDEFLVSQLFFIIDDYSHVLTNSE